MWPGKYRAALVVLIGVAGACSDEMPSAPTEGEGQPAAALVAGIGYKIRDLGMPAGCSFGQAQGINENGDVIVGFACGEAIRWQGGSTPFQLGTLPGHSFSEAFGVNNSGHIVGVSGGLTTEAFLYTPGTGMVSIHDPLLLADSRATAINNAGVVVGWGTTGGGVTRAFRWTQSGGMQLLTGDDALAMDINDEDHGTVVGWDFTGPTRAIIWSSSGVVTTLGTLGGSFSQARGINDYGKVVGASEIGDFFTIHGLLYTPAGGVLNDIGPMTSVNASALKISDRGRIVGDDGSTRNAITWYNGELRQLPDLGGHAEALDVSRCGTIVGFAEPASGAAQHPVRWDKKLSDCN